MFIPFLAATAIATALIKLGALSAWVTVLSLALKTVTMRIPIAICVVVCALVAASFYGLKGFFLGGLLGSIAPAALLWLGVMLVGATIFIAIYAAAWTAIVAFFWPGALPGPPGGRCGRGTPPIP